MKLRNAAVSWTILSSVILAGCGGDININEGDANCGDVSGKWSTTPQTDQTIIRTLGKPVWSRTLSFSTSDTNTKVLCDPLHYE